MGQIEIFESYVTSSHAIDALGGALKLAPGIKRTAERVAGDRDMVKKNLARCATQSHGYVNSIRETTPLFIQGGAHTRKKYHIQVLLVVARAICTAACVLAIEARIAELDERERVRALAETQRIAELDENERVRALAEEQHDDALAERERVRALAETQHAAAMLVTNAVADAAVAEAGAREKRAKAISGLLDQLCAERAQNGLAPLDRQLLLAEGVAAFGDEKLLEAPGYLQAAAVVYDAKRASESSADRAEQLGVAHARQIGELRGAVTSLVQTTGGGSVGNTPEAVTAAVQQAVVKYTETCGALTERTDELVRTQADLAALRGKVETLLELHGVADRGPGALDALVGIAEERAATLETHATGTRVLRLGFGEGECADADVPRLAVQKYTHRGAALQGIRTDVDALGCPDEQLREAVARRHGVVHADLQTTRAELHVCRDETAGANGRASHAEARLVHVRAPLMATPETIVDWMGRVMADGPSSAPAMVRTMVERVQELERTPGAALPMKVLRDTGSVLPAKRAHTDAACATLHNNDVLHRNAAAARGPEAMAVSIMDHADAQLGSDPQLVGPLRQMRQKYAEISALSHSFDMPPVAADERPTDHPAVMRPLGTFFIELEYCLRCLLMRGRGVLLDVLAHITGIPKQAWASFVPWRDNRHGCAPEPNVLDYRTEMQRIVKITHGLSVKQTSWRDLHYGAQLGFMHAAILGLLHAGIANGHLMYVYMTLLRSIGDATLETELRAFRTGFARHMLHGASAVHYTGNALPAPDNAAANEQDIDG